MIRDHFARGQDVQGDRLLGSTSATPTVEFSWRHAQTLSALPGIGRQVRIVASLAMMFCNVVAPQLFWFKISARISWVWIIPPPNAGM
jgi:hypothetical protein